MKTNTGGDSQGSGSGQPFLDQYAWNANSFAVSNAVNSFIATQTCRNSLLCEDNKNLTVRMAGGVPFPSPEV